MKKIFLMLIPTFAVFLALAGCAQANPESDIVAESVTVSDLLSNPDSYRGQTVLLAGSIEYVCPSDG